MRNKIALLVVLGLTFMTLSALSGTASSPGCDCSAHALTGSQGARYGSGH